MTQDYVSDEEELYRSVRREQADEYFYDSTNGQLIIESKAFLDRNKEPSVDRAMLKGFDPRKSRIGENDGVVSLITGEVRQIGDVVSNVPDGSKLNHAIDVIAKPEPQNEAHALIVVQPAYFPSDKKDKAFKLLRKALARLATQRGWTLEPKSW